MNKIGIFFGSDTGNTENVAKLIKKKLGNSSELFDIADSNKKIVEKYNKLIFGIPTWYYGEIQCDWEDFLPELKEINFSNKLVALFGCGDQEDYAEYFCDAMGKIYKILKKNNAKIVGLWSNKGYFFEKSKSLINKDYFVGLVIDEDRQPEMTKNRIENWVEQIKKEMNFY